MGQDRGCTQMHRFFVGPQDIKGNRVCLGPNQSHQIRDVLRLRPADRIIVLDNSGWEAIVELSCVSKGHVQGTVVSRQLVQTEATVSLTLYQALLPRVKFEWVLQKCTEVGVKRFVPFVADRSIARRSEADWRTLRWRKIITEAAEQSGRGIIPALDLPSRSEDVLSRPNPGYLRLIAVPGQEGCRLGTVLADWHGYTGLELCVGPEGGFSPRELVLAKTGGWVTFSMGRRILRTETAAVVACALILYQVGQMEP